MPRSDVQPAAAKLFEPPLVEVAVVVAVEVGVVVEVGVAVGVGVGVVVPVAVAVRVGVGVPVVCVAVAVGVGEGVGVGVESSPPKSKIPSSSSPPSVVWVGVGVGVVVEVFPPPVLFPAVEVRFGVAVALFPPLQLKLPPPPDVVVAVPVGAGVDPPLPPPPAVGVPAPCCADSVVLVAPPPVPAEVGVSSPPTDGASGATEPPPPIPMTTATPATNRSVPARNSRSCPGALAEALPLGSVSAVEPCSLPLGVPLWCPPLCPAVASILPGCRMSPPIVTGPVILLLASSTRSSAAVPRVGWCVTKPVAAHPRARHLPMTVSSPAASPDDESDAPRLFVGGDFVLPEPGGREVLAPGLHERVEGADLAMVNLEAPIDPDCDPIEKSGPAKASAAGTADVLADFGVDAVTLANNHAMDYGAAGLRRTQRRCRRRGVATCGAGEDRDAAMEPHRADLDGTSVAVFSFCEQEFGIADAGSAGTAWVSHPDARRRVAAEAERSDMTIVVAHGGVEYVPFPPLSRQTQLRGFVEAGADIVVGHHPHVPQGWEVHQGTPIFYSLGNFRFEQPSREKTDWGLALDLTIEDGEPTSVDLVPTEQRDGTVHEIDRDRALDEQLQYLYRVTERTAQREQLRAHWQETAARLFEQRYTGWLRQGTGARLRDQIRDPGQHVSRDAAWDGDRQDEMLVLLNVLRNESHRAVIETALGLKTGECEDVRTEEVRGTVRELVQWTEDRQLYDRPSPARANLGMLATRVSEWLPTLSDDTGSRASGDSESV